MFKKIMSSAAVAVSIVGVSAAAAPIRHGHRQ